jgi:MFS transporter, CP family, cyanate transporter
VVGTRGDPPVIWIGPRLRRLRQPSDVAGLGLGAALFLAALSLRPQLVGAAPLFPEIERDLGLSHATVGLLGTIPVLGMGLFAPLAPLAAAKLGTARAVGVAIALIGAFGLLRAGAGDAVQIVVATIGIGVGMGTGGALLPVVVKERLVSHPLAGTVAFSAGLQLGAAAGATLAVPIALASGGWRGALAIASIATLLIVVPWIVLTTRPSAPSDVRQTAGPTIEPLIGAARTSVLLGVLFALFGIVYYGLVAWLPAAYVELGWSAATAGALLGSLNVASLIGALTVGFAAGRIVPYGTALISLAIAFALATAGFVLVPGAGAAWAVVAGYANGALFPLILALPLRLSGSPREAGALASAMLGIGYTVAAVSPVGLGALRDSSGTFGASLWALIAAAVAFVVAVALVARQKAR